MKREELEDGLIVKQKASLIWCSLWSLCYRRWCSTQHFQIGTTSCAIEFRSYSKTPASPVAMQLYSCAKRTETKASTGTYVALNQLWHRHIHQIQRNGLYSTSSRSCILQERGSKRVGRYYLENAKTIREGLHEKGWTVMVVWIRRISGWKCPDTMIPGSFDQLLSAIWVRRVGFGPSGRELFSSHGTAVTKKQRKPSNE